LNINHLKACSHCARIVISEFSHFLSLWLKPRIERVPLVIGAETLDFVEVLLVVVGHWVALWKKIVAFGELALLVGDVVGAAKLEKVFVLAICFDCLATCFTGSMSTDNIMSSGDKNVLTISAFSV